MRAGWMVAAALLAAQGASAQPPASTPAPAPAASQAKPEGPMQPPTEQVIGRVTKIDLACGTVSVRDSAGEKALQTTGQTKVVVDGVERNSLSAVKQGQQMRASFARGGPPTLLEVRSKGRFEPAPQPGKPAGKAPAGRTPAPRGT